MSMRAHKIFHIPELVKLIQVYLDISQSVRLACSSRHLFQMAMPSLWERVDGASQLLVLLPALDQVNKRKRRGETPGKTLTGNDFSRFDVYAPWVKHLEVCQNQKPPPKVHQLDALFQYSATRVLLPNLKSITCTTNDGSVDLIWVLPFLSPSLLRVEFATTSITWVPDLSVREASVLLHILAGRCTELQTISIPAKADKNKITPGLYALKYVSDDDKAKVKDEFQLGLGPFIARIHPLASLTSSAEILDATCLGTIGTWPLLESLTITMDPLKRDYKLPELDTNAFPSLKHFGLYQIPDPAVFQMVWGSSALVKDLTSVKLLAAPKFFSYSNTKFSDALAEFLAVLAEQSPSLRGLWVRVQDPKLDRPSYDVPLITLASLQKLPLQKLYIEGINFSDYPYDEDDTEDNEFVGPRFDFVKYFSTSFPALKELGFPNHRAALTDSRMFCALLPRLESLRFDFDLDFAQWEPDFDLNEIPRHRNSPFRIFEANFLGICENEEEDNGLDITDLDYDDGVGLAHYLFSLWPNVRLAPQLEEDESKDHASHEKMLVSINNYLAELSCCNRDASIKYEEIKALDWAHGRIPRRGLLHLSPQEFYFSD